MPDRFRRSAISGQARHLELLQCGTVPAEILCGKQEAPSAAKNCIGRAGCRHTMNGGHQINDRSLATVMAEESSDAVDWLDTI